MPRLSCWSATVVFFGLLLVVLPLLFMSMNKDSRLVSLDISSSLRKHDAREKIQSTADQEIVIEQVTFTGQNIASSNGQKKNTVRSKSAEVSSPPRPSVTWLMSFPNSGTSYTMTNTEAVSQMSTATNYATEIPQRYGDLKPIPRIEGEVGDGPWQRNAELPLPSKRVLCKTHCAGYNDNGSVEESVLSFDAFVDGCRQSMQRKDRTTSFSRRNKLRLHYNSTGLVDSAIHLIRDPFDNVISRMHLGLRNQHKKNHTNMTSEELEAFMRTKEGVNSWCKTVDQHFWKEHGVTIDMHISNETLSLLPYDPTPYLDVPCHAEFFRYTQWHNLAVELIRNKDLSVLTVHYEDYVTLYNQTVDRILSFLGQSRKHTRRPFKSGKTYRDLFFENSMQHKAKHLIKEIASEETWKLLRGYFSSSRKDDKDGN